MPAASLFANAASLLIPALFSDVSAGVTRAQAGSFSIGETVLCSYSFPRGRTCSLGLFTCLTTSALHRDHSGLLRAYMEALGLSRISQPSPNLFSCSQPVLTKMEAPRLHDAPKTMLSGYAQR